MDKRLIQAGYIAIPILPTEGHAMFPQPNFIIIEDLGGKPRKVELPVLGDTLCISSNYKIVYREILPEEYGRAEEMKEFKMENSQQFVPKSAFNALSDYDTLKENIAVINQLLALFQFRGVMKNLQLVIDEATLDDIIELVNTPIILPTEPPVFPLITTTTIP